MMEGDKIMAALTQAAMNASAKPDVLAPSTLKALKALVLIGAAWRKERDAEIASASANPAQAALEAALAELAALKAAQAEAEHAPKPRRARGK